MRPHEDRLDAGFVNVAELAVDTRHCATSESGREVFEGVKPEDVEHRVILV